MRSAQIALPVLLTIVLALAVPNLASASTYTNFDIAGAMTIYPSSVNNAGQATGYYRSTTTGPLHGFLVQPDGTVNTFDVTGAAQTVPAGINGLGKIVGSFLDAANIYHGFIRSLAGQYATLNAPGAGTGALQGTEPLSINDAGQVSGIYIDSANDIHGFVRDAAGNYTAFDVPGAINVESAVLNQSGEIAGTYISFDSSTNCYCNHGYVRDSLGHLKTFSVPGALGLGTTTGAINKGGQITGIYFSGNSSGAMPYRRDAVGNITTFAVSGFSLLAGIEDNGDIVGAYFVGTSGTEYGWLRNSRGVISSFKDPNAGVGRSNGTYPVAVSGSGKVAGYYLDAQSLVHGFVMH